MPCRLTSLQDPSSALQFEDAAQLGHVHLGGQAPTLQPRSSLMELREPFSGGIASGSCEFVDRYPLQQSTQ